MKSPIEGTLLREHPGLAEDEQNPPTTQPEGQSVMPHDVCDRTTVDDGENPPRGTVASLPRIDPASTTPIAHTTVIHALQSPHAFAAREAAIIDGDGRGDGDIWSRMVVLCLTPKHSLNVGLLGPRVCAWCVKSWVCPALLFV